MQAATLPISAGWSWISDGFKLFKRQPMAMFFWSLTTGFLVTISYLIPLFGQMAFIAVTPLLTFVTLSACRNISGGRPMLLPMWLEPVRNREIRKRLLRVGLAYLVCCLIGGVLATLPFMDDLSNAIQADAPLDEAALWKAMQAPFYTFGVIYIAISALFWHAPALTGWHGIKMTQALFYSMVACWRNKWAFLLYGASWAAIFFAVQVTGSFLIALGLSPSFMQIILTPLNMAVIAVLYCSFYPAYVSVFGANYPTDGAPLTSP